MSQSHRSSAPSLAPSVPMTAREILGLRRDFTPEQHVGFEAAAWYWHFVDVVWLFLFAAIYVWGAG